MHKLLQPISPVPWANLGPASQWIARRLPAAKPPVLVISLPRSGSSWVGRVLGRSPSALYLREPLTQPLQAKRAEPGLTVFDPADDEEGRLYERCGDRAFAGVPAFHVGIVDRPLRWTFARRSNKRVVIKEVNPLAIPWMMERYRPKVIHLVRHPAAVAASFASLGWKRSALTDHFWHRRQGRYDKPTGESGDFWQDTGVFQAIVTREVLRWLADSDQAMVVRYEDVCLDPPGQFRKLYEFAGLAWTPAVDRFVESLSAAAAPKDNKSPYGTTRDSRSMVNAWKAKVPDDKAEVLHSAWEAYEVPFYREDW